MNSSNQQVIFLTSSDKETMVDDTAPLLVATPLVYGTSPEPETVTFDETAVLPATGQALEENDPLLIRNVSSADYSKIEEAPVFRDVPFAVLFWLQLIAVLGLGFTVAPQGYAMLDMQFIKKQIEADPDSTPSDVQDFETFVTFVAQYVQVYPSRVVQYLLYPTSLLAFGMALAVTSMIIRPWPRFLVTLCLVVTFLDAVLLMGVMIVGSGFSPLMILVAALILGGVAYYIKVAWRLIPHSAVNLGVALDGVQSNCSIYIIALCLAELGFFWAFYWSYVLVGTMIYVGETQCPGMTDEDDCGPQGWTFLFLLLSFYWTSQVISNTIQVTVAGVMATWCFDFDFAQNCCSSAVWTSLYRSLTYSFGSICFGSLLLAIVRIIRYFVENAKKQSRGDNHCESSGMIQCLLECFIQFFEEVLDYFNHWAYVFCGIYGYSYLQSGKMVVELFRARGWENIVTDDLIGYVLGFTTFSVGLLTGVGSMCLERIVDSMMEPDPPDETKDELLPWDTNISFLFGPIPNPQFLALGIGFFIGVIVCSVMMNVVRGAVNTLIVCWADSPARLEENHPEATKEMAETWTKVFPEARVYLTPGLPTEAPTIT